MAAVIGGLLAMSVSPKSDGAPPEEARQFYALTSRLSSAMPSHGQFSIPAQQ